MSAPAQINIDRMLRYRGANPYKSKGQARPSPIWPKEMLAQRPGYGHKDAIVQGFPHSPRRRVKLINPYGTSVPPDDLADTRRLTRLKRAGVSSRKTTQENAFRATAAIDRQFHGTENELQRTVRGSEMLSKNPMNKKFNTTDPRSMYLLTNYLAFDKFDEHERGELMEDVVDKWLSEEYSLEKGSDSMWHNVRAYCESSCMLNKWSSTRNTPNPLSAALCCEMLEILSRKEQRYGRVLRVLKDGLFAAIYINSENSRKPFFHRETWFDKAKIAEKVLKKTRLEKADRCATEEHTFRNDPERTLPAELARHIYAMGPAYTTQVMETLSILQRTGTTHGNKHSNTAKKISANVHGIGQRTTHLDESQLSNQSMYNDVSDTDELEFDGELGFAGSRMAEHDSEAGESIDHVHDWSG